MNLLACDLRMAFLGVLFPEHIEGLCTCMLDDTTVVCKRFALIG